MDQHAPSRLESDFRERDGMVFAYLSDSVQVSVISFARL
jgi:hypothetical protein